MNKYIILKLQLLEVCDEFKGSDCSEPMTYEWLITLPGQTQTLPKIIDHSPTGLNNIEVAISSTFLEP